MKIIEPKVQEVKDFEGVDNFYKAVARAARICYAKEMLTEEQVQYLLQQGEMTLSESIKNIASIENDKALCARLLKSKHYSPFSHAILHLKSTYMELTADNEFIDRALTVIYGNKYALQYYGGEIIVNGRIIVEAIDSIEELSIERLDEVLNFIKSNNLEFVGDVHPYHFRSFIVDTSIGCTREMNRHHNNFYICEQSTRYCNFSKNKFGGEISVNEPYWFDNEEYFNKMFPYWDYSIQVAEKQYLDALKAGVPTDIARGILPLDTHTRAIYTATLEEWKHIIDLRLKGDTGKPHGDIKIIAEKINNLINGI